MSELAIVRALWALAAVLALLGIAVDKTAAPQAPQPCSVTWHAQRGDSLYFEVVRWKREACTIPADYPEDR